MSSEDFPALPGTTPSGSGGVNNEAGAQAQAQNASQTLDPSSSEPRLNNQTGEAPQKRGIVTSPEGNEGKNNIENCITFYYFHIIYKFVFALPCNCTGLILILFTGKVTNIPASMVNVSNLLSLLF